MTTAAPYRSNRTPQVQVDAVEHHIGDLSATVGAAVTLGRLRTILAQHQQWLPIDGADDLPIGQAVAMNTTGPLRLGYGAWRDLLLGAQFINDGGELISAGGRTVKNVAGYDLTKLMVGQGGDLGRLVTITTRTYRLPTHALHVRLDPAQPIASLMTTPLRPQWAMRSPAGLECGYLGDGRTIEWIEGELPRIRPLAIQRRSVDADIAHRAARWTWPIEGMARLALPPAALAAFGSSLTTDDWIADAAFGVILLPILALPATAVRGVALEAGQLRPIGLNEGEQCLAQRLREAMNGQP